MSDNLCGPSAPTKGLINQLDRDNSRHQTRTAAPRGPFDRNFRTAAETANSGAQDAHLNQFLSGPAGPPPPGSLVPFPVGSPYQLHHQTPAHDDLRRQQNLQGALLGGGGGPGRVSTDWVNDFRNMHLNHINPANPQISSSPAAAQLHPAHAAAAHAAAAPAEHAVLHPLPPSYANQFLNQPYHAGPFLGGPQFQQHHGAQQANPSYGPAMAPSETQALDDVFAELFAAVESAQDDKTKADQQQEDARLQNLEEEMDQREAVQSPYLNKQMQQILNDLGMKADDVYVPPGVYRQEDQQQQQPQQQPQPHTQDLPDDHALRRAAQDIMQTLSTNQSEKFQNSAFIGLMSRISQQEVVLQGNDLFDTTTGTVLGGDNNNNNNNNNNASAAHDDPKGKGKANEEAATGPPPHPNAA